MYTVHTDSTYLLLKTLKKYSSPETIPLKRNISNMKLKPIIECLVSILRATQLKLCISSKTNECALIANSQCLVKTDLQYKQPPAIMRHFLTYIS
jgi:hypothetical protein